jgi:hypothetical protein
MNLIETFIQLFFILALLLLFCFYLLVVFAAKRAISQTKVPIAVFWKCILIINFLFILGSLIFVVLTKP